MDGRRERAEEGAERARRRPSGRARSSIQIEQRCPRASSARTRLAIVVCPPLPRRKCGTTTARSSGPSAGGRRRPAAPGPSRSSRAIAVASSSAGRRAPARGAPSSRRSRALIAASLRRMAPHARRSGRMNQRTAAALHDPLERQQRARCGSAAGRGRRRTAACVCTPARASAMSASRARRRGGGGARWIARRAAAITIPCCSHDGQPRRSAARCGAGSAAARGRAPAGRARAPSRATSSQSTTSPFQPCSTYSSWPVTGGRHRVAPMWKPSSGGPYMPSTRESLSTTCDSA